MQPGHVLFDDDGLIVEADEPFGVLLMSPVDALRGRDVLSLTAAADRAECTQAIAGLQATGRAFDITKRFVRQDGSVVWVRNSVSRISLQATTLLVATCAPVRDRASHDTPGILLESARRQASMVEARRGLGDPLLMSGVSWGALLEAYIAEAEGRIVDVAMLARRLDVERAIVRRWVDALLSSDFLEVETRDPRPDTAKAYRLTLSATRRLEAYLDRFAPAQSD